MSNAYVRTYIEVQLAHTPLVRKELDALGYNDVNNEAHMGLPPLGSSCATYYCTEKSGRCLIIFVQVCFKRKCQIVFCVALE